MENIIKRRWYDEDATVSLAVGLIENSEKVKQLECAKYIKEKDPDTAITEYAIRKMVANKQIKSIRTGKKYLINIEEVERFFENL